METWVGSESCAVSGHREWMLVLRVGLKAICHEANVFKAALRPITARQGVELAADWPDKLWRVARIGA